MSEFIKWFLIIGFGILFMGLEFFVFVFAVFVLMSILSTYFPNWFNGI